MTKSKQEKREPNPWELKTSNPTLEDQFKKEGCQHENVDVWFDEDSGDNTVTCEDCGEVWYHEDYQQRLAKE